MSVQFVDDETGEMTPVPSAPAQAVAVPFRAPASLMFAFPILGLVAGVLLRLIGLSLGISAGYAIFGVAVALLLGLIVGGLLVAGLVVLGIGGTRGEVIGAATGAFAALLLGANL